MARSPQRDEGGHVDRKRASRTSLWDQIYRAEPVAQWTKYTIRPVAALSSFSVPPGWARSLFALPAGEMPQANFLTPAAIISRFRAWISSIIASVTTDGSNSSGR